MGLRRDDQKRAVRKQALAARDALSPAERRSKSAAIARRLGRLLAFRNARTVFVYSSMRSEVQTRRIMQAARSAGKRVALPVSVKRGNRLEFRLVNNLDADLAPGMMDIMEPKLSCPRVAPGQSDCVIVPGIAFDRRGHRIGYGGGYYDRFLRLADDAPRVGVAFEVQLVPRVPNARHDQHLHFIVTERRAIRCKPER